MTTIDSRLPQFRSKTVPERLQHLVTAAHLSDEDARRLTHSGALGPQLADGMIENVVGTFELPLGVAGYFQLNGKDVLVPMAVEEPSVVAAASFMAKLARECGGFETSSTTPLMRAQVQVLGLGDPHGARQSLLRRRQRGSPAQTVRKVVRREQYDPDRQERRDHDSREPGREAEVRHHDTCRTGAVSR